MCPSLHDAGRLERRFIHRPRCDELLILAPVMHEHGGLDLRHVRQRGCAAVERRDRLHVCSHPHSQTVGNAAAEAEAGDRRADRCCRDDSSATSPPERGLPDILVRSTDANSFPPCVVVSGVAAHRGQPIRRERHEAFEREASGDVFDVRIESAVLMDHEDRRAACWSRRWSAARDSP